jgi:alpha-L-fucosidase
MTRITSRHLIAFAAALALSQSALVARADAPAEGVAVDAATKPAVVAETAAERDARMAWWRDAKFGLFIHWGVYAVPAGKWGEKTSYGEWIMQSARIPVATYQDLAKQFNPVKYDPAAWVQVAQDSGMRYIVITSKHHDGFALFPTKVSKWNVVDASPYGKDLLAPLVEQAHAKGLKIGFYYSQSQDWNNPGGAKSGFKEGEGWDDAHKGSYDDYLKNIAVPQTREILTNYPIDILWWDTPMYQTKERAAPLAELLKLRPGIITNNRLGGGFKGDTETPEQFIPVTGYAGDWETCMTTNGHWGYNAYDKNWKSGTDLIRKLADVCSKGGNFLLNVGPTAEGEFPAEAVKNLLEVGAWLKVNGDSIYGTRAGPFAFLPYGCATRKGDKLFLHVFNWPADGKLNVPLQSEIASAHLLATPDAKLAVERVGEHLQLTLPTTAPDSANSVIVLQLAGEPVVAPLPSVGATVTATSVLDDGNAAANVLDGTAAKRWRAAKDVKSASIELALKSESTLAGFGLDEPDVWPRMKQKFTLEAKVGDAWQTIASGNMGGHGVKKAFTPVTTQAVRLTVECEAGSPGVAELQLYAQ